MKASPELLALMARKPPPDPELVAGYMSGDLQTRSAGWRPHGLRHLYGGRFTRQRPQRSPDRERSIQRRRQLAATWPMPPAMAGKLTTSQLAYARIVADEIALHGRCDRTLDEIAARGGMCRKTAKRAQDRLVELKWIDVRERPIKGRKHLPNVVHIVSPEWETWIKMGPKPRPIGGHSRPTTDNKFISKSINSSAARAEKPRAGIRGVPWCTGEPPNRLRNEGMT